MRASKAKAIWQLFNAVPQANAQLRVALAVDALSVRASMSMHDSLLRFFNRLTYLLKGTCIQTNYDARALSQRTEGGVGSKRLNRRANGLVKWGSVHEVNA